VSQLASAALRAVDATDPRRSGGRPVRAGPVPDVTRSNWCTQVLSGDVLDRAIDFARLFVTQTGTTASADAVLAELDRYAAVTRADRLRLADPRRTVSTSRARALVALGVWHVLRRPRATRPSVASLGSLQPPPGFIPVAPAVARLIQGEATTEVLAACCDEVRRLSTRDRAAAAVVADLVLARHRSPGRPRIGRDTAARILQTVVRLRSESPTPA
jgi:hypothetical protein